MFKLSRLKMGVERPEKRGIILPTPVMAAPRVSHYTTRTAAPTGKMVSKSMKTSILNMNSNQVLTPIS